MKCNVAYDNSFIENLTQEIFHSKFLAQQKERPYSHVNKIKFILFNFLLDQLYRFLTSNSYKNIV